MRGFKERFIPNNFVLHTEIKELGLQIYTQDKTMLAYAGKRNKPDIYCIYKSLESMQKALLNYIENIKTSQKDKLERMAKRKQAIQNAKNNVKIGDIFKASWGYDQTNIDFYQVVKVKGSMVDIRELAQKREYTGYLSGDCVPVPDVFLNEKVLTKKIQAFNETIYLSINSYCNAYLEKPVIIDGVKIFKESYYSEYA